MKLRFRALTLVVLMAASLGAQGADTRGNHFTVYADTVEALFPPAFPPVPGDRVVFSRDVYAADLSDPANPVPVGNVIGSNITICTAAGSAGLHCIGSVTLWGQGTLTLQAPFVFLNPTEVAVTGGTGRFAGAKGTMLGWELNQEADQLFEFNLSRKKSKTNRR